MQFWDNATEGQTDTLQTWNIVDRVLAAGSQRLQSSNPGNRYSEFWPFLSRELITQQHQIEITAAKIVTIVHYYPGSQ